MIHVLFAQLCRRCAPCVLSTNSSCRRANILYSSSPEKREMKGRQGRLTNTTTSQGNVQLGTYTRYFRDLMNDDSVGWFGARSVPPRPRRSYTAKEHYEKKREKYETFFRIVSPAKVETVIGINRAFHYWFLYTSYSPLRFSSILSFAMNNHLGLERCASDMNARGVAAAYNGWR